ncbi:nuclear transport factor 2 family protein (plasmid) [Mycolicibacterium psychrotolerans]|uniref:nuclear transport factor 2 family protein n=1 Tax=Mycolicibacterium psychrotolerans TaxID=216929 RepID=UPI003D6771D3
MTDIKEPGAVVSSAAIEAVIGRHIAAEALARYCSAMDRRDARAAASLLANADLYFKDLPRNRGRKDIEEFYADLFSASTGDTAHLINNLVVTVDAARIGYTCRYQRVNLVDTAGPTISAIGCYTGYFVRVGPESIWREHHVIAR